MFRSYRCFRYFYRSIKFLNKHINRSTYYYFIKRDEFNNTIYMDPLPKRARYKKYRCLNQGSSIEDRDTYVIRKFCINNPADVQFFNLHSNHNMHSAVTERVCQSNVTPTYNPNYELNKKIMTDLYNQLRDQFKPEWQIFNLEAMREFIMNHRSYTTKQKIQICEQETNLSLMNWLEILRENWDKLYFDEKGRLIMKGLHNPIAKEARFSAFIKDESYPESKRDRNITGASDLDKFIFGVFQEAMGQVFFHQDFAIKTIPYELRPQVIEKRLAGEGFVYGFDQTAFESAATKDIQMCGEQLFYSMCYPSMTKYFLKYTDFLIFKCGRTGPTYCVETSRASGSPFTSLGNSLNNYMYIKNLESHSGGQFKFILEGDDCIVKSTVRLDHQDVVDYSYTQGFDVKLEEFNHLHEVGFLSMTWNPDNLVVDGIKPWKVLMDAITFNPNRVLVNRTFNEPLYWKYQTAKLMSLSLLYPKHDLIHNLFEYSYRKHIHFNKDKSFMQYSDKDFKRKIRMLGITNVRDKNVVDRIKAKWHPELYYETQTYYNYTQQLSNLMKLELESFDDKMFEKWLNITIDIYWKAIPNFYQTDVFSFSAGKKLDELTK